MFGFYTPVLILQAFCLYHAYKNNNQQKWYWMIIFFPVGGCLIYLYDSFYNTNKLRNVSEVAKNLVNSNRRIELLERDVKINDSTINKLNLADAYMTINRLEEAVKIYESCLTGFRSEDPVIQMKLLSAYFSTSEYKKVIDLGEKLSNHKEFKNSEERIALGWAYFFLNNSSTAINIFNDLNIAFANYRHRVEYTKLLLRMEKREEAASVLNQLLEEFDLIKGHERSVNRSFAREAKELSKQLV
jgi:hypothetical protein